MRFARTILTVGLFLLATSALPYPQRVFVEDFTSATCPPCATEIPHMEDLLDEYSRDQMILISFHMSWPAPGNDPYYLANTGENNTRRAYYGINSIPAFVIDGTVDSYRPSQSQFQNVIENRLDRETPFLIEIEPSFSDNTVQTDVSVTFDEATAAGTVLYIALVEEHGVISSSWVAHEFSYSMLDMSPGASGITVTSEGASETQTFSQTFGFDESWEVPNLSVIAWMQIQGSHEIVQANIAGVPTNIPSLSITSTMIDDAEESMPNGRADAGETTDLTITLGNQLEFLATSNLTGTITCDDENLVLEDALATWATIEPGAEQSNETDPFTISVPEEYSARHVTFTIHLSDDSGYEADMNFTMLVGTPNVALVNDFDQGRDVSEAWYDIFLEAGFAAQEYTVTDALESDLTSYEYLIWATSTDIEDVLDDDDIAAITDYLDNGGMLILTGENIGEDEGSNEWFHTYFGAEHRLDSPPAASRVRVLGLADGPFSEHDLTLVGGAGNSLFPSTITPREGAVPFYKFISTLETAGVGYRGDGFVSVYLSFNIEAASGLNNTTTAATALNEIMDWMAFESDVPSEGAIELPETISMSAYPNPFNAAVTVNFTTPQNSPVNLSVFNVMGQKVATLHQGPIQAGSHQVSWDATHEATGVYLLHLESGSERRTQKLLLVK